MIDVNINNVKAETTNEPKPGGYIFRIIDTNHKPENQGVVLELDIDEGEFKGYYMDLNAKFGFWALSTYRSYKGGALKYFAEFVHNLESSNPGYKWDQDETKWRGKRIGGVLYYEEYTGNDGRKKKRAKIDKFYSIDDIKNGEFVLPEKKTENLIMNAAFVPVDDKEIPF